MCGAASIVTHQIRWRFRHRMAEKCRREWAFRRKEHSNYEELGSCNHAWCSMHGDACRARQYLWLIHLGASAGLWCSPVSSGSSSWGGRICLHGSGRLLLRLRALLLLQQLKQVKCGDWGLGIRAGQSRADQGRAGQGRAGQGRAGWNRLERRKAE